MLGREREAEQVQEQLAGGRAVVVWGVPGSGRSTFLDAVLLGHRVRRGNGLATLAFRPFHALEIAVGGAAPAGDAGRVAEWLAERLGGHVLAIDDAHLAHPATIDVLALLAGRVPMVLAGAEGRPGSARLATALAGWGPLAPGEVVLAPLPEEVARQVVHGCRPELPPAEVDAVVAGGHGVPAWLVAGAGGPTAPAEQVVASLGVAARTALAAAALLGRPAAAELLGPGTGELLAAGMARAVPSGDVEVVPTLARAALARVTEPDRAALHGALARRLGDHGERARHLAAAGRTDDAVTAAVEAAASAPTPVERAAHLHFAASLDRDPGAAAAALAALLAAGDLRTALGWVPALAGDDPEHCVVAARAHRYAGMPTDASRWVVAGLRAQDRLEPGSPAARRRLLVEAAWLGAAAASAGPAALAVAACAGTPEQGAAHAAAALAGFAASAGGGDPLPPHRIDLLALEVPERFHVGMLVARTLLAVGHAAPATEVLDRVAALADEVGAGTWAGLARVESAWCRYLLDGGDEILAGLTELLREVLSASARDRARALLHLALVDRDLVAPPLPLGVAARGLWAAVAAEASLAADDRGGAGVHAALAGLPAADPLVALLAGPASIATGAPVEPTEPELSAFPLLHAEAVAVHAADPVALGSVAERWRGVAARGVARCLLAAGAAGDAGGRTCAAEVAGSAGLARWAARAGAPAPRTDGPLSGRERQVLELVAAGCTTPTIARRLGIAASTVDSHVKSAKVKLGVSTRAGAVARL